MLNPNRYYRSACVLLGTIDMFFCSYTNHTVLLNIDLEQILLSCIARLLQCYFFNVASEFPLLKILLEFLLKLY